MSRSFPAPLARTEATNRSARPSSHALELSAAPPSRSTPPVARTQKTRSSQALDSASSRRTSRPISQTTRMRDILLHDGPKETDKSDDPKEGRKLPVLQSAIAISVSFTICKLATYVTKVFGIPGGNLPCITAIIVILATIFPAQFGALAPAGEAIAFILMQVFFAVVGANGSLWNVINTTPSIFAYSSIQIVVHVAVILGLGKLFGFEKKMLLIASNANVGGPTTACGMATAKGWNSLIIPGILAGVFGIAIATFIGIAFGLFVLKYM